MKKIFLALTFLVSQIMFADQYELLTYGQALQAKKFLEKQKKVVLHCNCCDDSPKKLIEIESVEIKKYDNYYQIELKGYNKTDNIIFSDTIDIAYTHIIKRKKAYSVAKKLGWEVASCTEPFEYKG